MRGAPQACGEVYVWNALFCTHTFVASQSTLFRCLHTRTNRAIVPTPAEQNCIELKELGAVPRLVKLLGSPDKPARAYAVLCVGAMVGVQPVRRALLKTPCIPPLLDALKPEGSE